MKNKDPYSVLELCEEFASETIEFARFFESAFVFLGVNQFLDRSLTIESGITL